MSFQVEDLFKSIDVIVEQRLANLSYDQTVIATVVDDSEKSEGHYIVSNGTIKFDAYCADVKYKVNDQVRVSVLNGDWTQKKFIVGKYNNDGDESAVPYVAPLDNVYQAPFSKETIDSYLLETDSEAAVFAKTIEEGSSDYVLQTNGVYDVITLSGNFQTSLGTLVAGGYGVRLDFFIQMEKGSRERYNKFITFDSSEMIGNPYNFTIPTYQEKKIVVNTSGGIIREIALRVYKGIRYEDDGTKVDNSFKDRDGNKVKGTVKFSNLQIGFGTNLVNIENNKLQIYTKSPVTYGYNDGQPGEAKQIGLIWYNKDADDKYIGFSDGIYDKAYDEMTYLKASYQDARLMTQANKTTVADDETSLRIAADWAETKPIMQSILKKLTSDLAQVIQSFGRQLAGTEFVKTKVNPLINSYVEKKEGETEEKTYPAKLVQAESTAETLLTELDKLTTNVLQYRYNIQKGIEKNDWDSAWSFNDKKIELFQGTVEEGLGYVTTMLEAGGEITSSGAVLAGYRGIYESYKPKIEAVQEEIRELSTKLIDNQQALVDSKDVTKEDLVSYVSRDTKEYEKRYCIWWYRYNPGYKLGEEENKYANFFGDNWERVAAPGLTDLMFQVGEEADGVQMNKANPAEELIWSRQMDPCSEYEEYKAILFFNHAKYYSDSIMFTNTEVDQIPNESKWNASDKLVINHDVYSYEHFQVYSQAHDLVNIKDGSLERQLKLSYDGVLSGNEALAAADVRWYVPLNSTLLSYDKEYLTGKKDNDKDKGKGFDVIAENSPDYKAGYIGFHKALGKDVSYKDATDSCGNNIQKPNSDKEEYVQEEVITVPNDDLYFFYKIKSFYEPAASNNTILVEARLADGNELASEISFTFSTFGTNGSKYTLAVVPETTQIAIVGQKDLSLSVTLRDSEGTKIDIVDTAINYDKATAYKLEAQWWDQGPYGVAIKREDNKDFDLLKVSCKPGETSRYVGIVEVGITAVLDQESGREALLSALYPVPYASKEDYFISGPTVIVYNNQGVVSRLSDEPFRLYDELGEVANQSWEIGYYYNDGKENSNTKEISEVWSKKDEREQVLAYMPKLNQDNTLRAAPMYYKFAENERIVPVVTCRVDGEIAWTQPIVITQNNYASSTLNEWDGKFQIDDKNGTILSTMVGAGVKNKDNSFSGVLMGDVEVGAMDTDNASGIGLYGFHEGAQSFHFGVDGTAFLGKSGRGRICFDGNSGVIKSASYEHKAPIYDEEDPEKIIGYKDESTACMKIDLDNGQIDMKGTVINEENNSSTGTKSRIKLDVQSPYLEVISEEGNKIIEVASNEYYLQSDNFEAAKFLDLDKDIDAIEDAFVDAEDGKGMKIDLQQGTINAYQFQLASKNILLNAGDNAKDYLAVRNNNGEILMYLGESRQFLKSDTFIAPDNSDDKHYPGMGMRIDLGAGKIEAYSDFELRAGTTSADGEGKYHENIVITSDGGSENNPYLKIANNSNQKMMVVTDSNFYLQSPDFSESESGKTGLKFDITHGSINAYSGFTLDAYKKDSGNNTIGRIIISTKTKESSCPFQIIGSGDEATRNQFKINWNGSLEARGGTFEGSISASSGTIGGWEIKNGGLYGGYIEAAQGKIGGWNINKDSLSGTGDGAITLSPSGISSAYWNTKEDGTTTLENLSVEKTLTVKNTTSDGTTASVSFDGNVDIKGSLNIQANLSIGTGKMFYLGGNQNSSGGHLYFGNNYIYINAARLQLGNAGDTGIITLNGTTTSDYIQFRRTVSCYDGGKWLPGVDGTITYYNSFFGKKQTMTFKKGILVEAPDAEEDTSVPAISSANKDAFLQSTGTATTWTKLGKMAFVDDIKKKVDITMTGKMSGGYYTKSGSQNYTPIGEAVTRYAKSSTTSITRYIYKNPAGTLIASQTQMSSTALTYLGSVTISGLSLTGDGGTYYRAGSQKSYDTYSAVGDVTLKATGSQEITIEPNSGTTTESLAISIANATFTTS